MDFGSPLTDPRMMLAQQLMQSSGDASPVRSWTQELARALNPAIGAYMFNKGQGEYNDTMAKALQASKSPGWVSPDTFQGNNGQTIQAGTVAPGTGGEDAMMGVLQSNPMTRGLATQMQMKRIEDQHKLADALAEYKGKGDIDVGIKPKIAAGEAAAKQPYEQQNTLYSSNLGLRNTLAGGQQAADLALRNDWKKPFQLAPGATIGALGGPPGADGSPGYTTLATSPNPSPGSQPGEIEQYYGKQFVEGQNAAIEGRKQLNSTRAIQSLLNGVQTGTGAATTQQLKKAALGIGIDLDSLGVSNDVGPKEAATALANAYALQLRNPAGGAGMPGAMSDADRQFLQNMTPNIGITPEGRQQMVQVQEKLQQRNEEVANMQRQYLRSHGGKLDSGWLDNLQQYSESHPLFKDMAPVAAPAPTSPPPQTIPDGATATNPQTGQKVIRKGGQWMPAP